MSPCEEKIVRLMLAALESEQKITSDEICRLAERAKRDPDEIVRTFWTPRRLACTLLAIDDIRNGHQEKDLIQRWFIPFLQHIRGRPVGHISLRGQLTPLRKVRNFAHRHHISLRL
jgi:hypothetical protein